MANFLERPYTVCVEGNIGSGKTTFLNYFDQNECVTVFPEPLQYWRDCGGENLLNRMYEDPRKWGFTFQSYVQLTMVRIHQAEVLGRVKLMERSLHSVQYCFIKKMYQEGLMDEPCKTLLEDWYKHLTAREDTKVDLIVYLRTSPEVAYERILARNRSEEKTVPVEYIKSLHQLHDDWLYHKTVVEFDTPVVVLDADKDKSMMIDEYKKHEAQILNLVP